MVSEQLAQALREASDEEVERLLFDDLEQLLRYPAPPQIAVLAGALQCDLAVRMGILDAPGDLLPRVVAHAPESHVSLFRSRILALPRVSMTLRSAITDYLGAHDLTSAT